MSEVSTLPQGSDPVTHDELGTVLVASGIASTASQTVLADQVQTVVDAADPAILSDADPADIAAAADPGVSTDVSRADHAHKATLAEVVAAGKDPGNAVGATSVEAATDGDFGGASVSLNPGVDPDGSGRASLDGGYTGTHDGAGFTAGGAGDGHGKAQIYSDGSKGNAGDQLIADGAGNATWQAPDSFWEYDFDIDGGAQGTIPLRGAAIPANSFVNAAFVRVITPFTSDGLATVAVTTGESAGDVDTAAAFDNAKYASGFHAVSVHKFTTDDRAPAIVVDVADLTAGKIEVLFDTSAGWS